MDEAELIQRAQAGDRRAFGALFDAYYPCVYRFLNERLGGAPEAEDLCQETFLTVLGSIDEFPTGGTLSFDQWLLRVARRLATEHYRRQGPLHRRADAVPPLVRSRLSPAAMELLPEGQRQVVAYRFGAGMSARQTAAALGLEAGIVRRIVQAAFETWLHAAPAGGDPSERG